MALASNLKFFIVDDDPFYRMLYQQHLLNMGFKNSILINSGDECLNRLYMEPDIIFLDYNMPSSNGLEVLRKIKMTHPNICILLISAQKDIQVAVNALKHGASDYIIKGDEDLNMISGVLTKILTRKVPISKVFELN